MPSLRHENPEWEAQTASLMAKASKRSSVDVAWTPAEDAVLLRLLITYTDVQEWQMKMAARFDDECTNFDVATPTKREYLDIIKRLQILQNDQLKYDINLVNRETLYPGTEDGPLWDDKGESSSSSRATKAASHSPEEEEQQQEEEKEEEEESESDEDEVVEVVKVKKKKQTKVVEVEESEDDEEEENTEEEANTGHNQAEHRVEAEGASQQQNTQANAAAAANNQDDSPRGTKREPTLLLEAGGKRIRIGIPPKGTKIKCYPEHGSIELKF